MRKINPFNPSTIIKFDIPKESFVTLKIYDILGREVAMLVKEEEQPGKYQVTFNASGLAPKGSILTSGVYFYRIAIHSDRVKAGDFIQT